MSYQPYYPSDGQQQPPYGYQNGAQYNQGQYQPSQNHYSGYQQQPPPYNNNSYGYPGVNAPPVPATQIQDKTNDNLFCDVCRASIDGQSEAYWRCSSCSSRDFDMCNSCFARGAQCFCGNGNASLQRRVPGPSGQPYHTGGYYGPANRPTNPEPSAATGSNQPNAAQAPAQASDPAATSGNAQSTEDGYDKLMAMLDNRIKEGREQAAQAAAAQPAAAQNGAVANAAAGGHLVQMQHLQLMGMMHSWNMGGGYGGMV